MYSDNQLIRKVNKTGSRQAANALIQRYYDEIYAYAYKQTLDTELAKDLTQDIFIAVLKSLNTFDDRKASFRTWLYKIASNKITDYFRSRYHRQRVLEVDMAELSKSPPNFSEEDALLAGIYEDQLMERVMAIVVEYGNQWVEIFQMKLFQEKTFGEISADLDLAENTVKTRYYAMIKKVRKELKDVNRN